MLNEKFLARLHVAFPDFYGRVREEAASDAAMLLHDADGDVTQALVRARLMGAGRIWAPYVKGSIPWIGKGKERDAMEAFSRVVLTVDELAGYRPPTMEAARDQVVNVLRNSLDVERLRRLLDRDQRKAATGAAASAGIMASATALMSPITAYRQARRWMRFVPVPIRVAAGAVVAAAVLSIPLVAGYSAGIQAEKAARNAADAPSTGPAATGPNGGGEPQREGRSLTRASR